MSRCLTVTFVVALTLVPAVARAQGGVTFVPSMSISSVYDDNLFARRIGSGDQMTLFTPGIEMQLATVRNTVAAFYTFDMQRSLNHPALNDLEARRHALFDGRFRQTPRLTLGLVSRYDRTETAGELNFTTGLLLDRQRARRLEITPSVAYATGPRTSINVLYDLTAEKIETQAAAQENTVRAGFMHQRSPRLTAGLMYLGRYFINGADSLPTIQPPLVQVMFDGDRPSFLDQQTTGIDLQRVFERETHTSNAALFTATYLMSPATVLTLQAGPRLSSRGTLQPEVVAALARTITNSVGFGVDLWRGESIILGVRGPVEVLSATGKFAWAFRRNTELGVRGGAFDTSTLSNGHARVYHAEVGTAWTPRESLIVAFSYGADFQRGDVRTVLLSNRHVVRHVFLVRMTAAPRLSRAFKPEDPLLPLGDPSEGVQR